MRAKRLTIDHAKEIFLALVEFQDAGLAPVADSLRHVSKQYRITEEQLRLIQEEGLEKEWPPLDDAPSLS